MIRRVVVPRLRARHGVLESGVNRQNRRRSAGSGETSAQESMMDLLWYLGPKCLPTALCGLRIAFESSMTRGIHATYGMFAVRWHPFP
jgi:hypothetical protein